MKKVWITFVTLISISFLLLLYQWTFVQNHDSNEKKDTAEVTVTIKEEGVGVLSLYKSIEPGTYKLIFPEGSSQLNCTLESGADCRIMDGNNTPTVHLENEETLTISYQREPLQRDRLMDWMMDLEKNDQTVDFSYTIAIQDYIHLDRTWAGLSEKTSDIRQEYVRFHQFSAVNQASFPLLLVEKNRDFWMGTKGVVTFPEEKPLSDAFKKNYNQLAVDYPPKIVEVDKKEAVSNKYYLAFKDRSVPNMDRVMFEQFISLYTDKNEKWLVDALSTIIFTSDDQGEVSGPMERLPFQFNDEQREELKQELLKVKDTDSIVTAADQALSEIEGMDVEFFKQVQENEGKTPLYFTYPKTLLVDGEEVDWKAVNWKKNVYYPFKALTNSLEYPVTEFNKGNSYRVRLPNNEYRFYKDQSIFIKNEQEFGVASDLLVKIDNQIFMKEQYVKDLLGVDIVEKQNMILMQKK
ncbi:hypothetical protein LCL89_05935 [Halobacillus yeomjeoni]|uniref:hypothetical protein n=1 Tax=Halobacillus yeomjeoni TaxID=311194 RepID=UPI001CD43EF6|nr:hypothetical protein [Halobacillus yeomjeoni]MCA0983594.1 hypothetical protein [Halobacillus yeomjeoni]